MKLFYVSTRENNRETPPRTWLVIAENLTDARCLLPGNAPIRQAEAAERRVDGPPRVIGWIGDS